MTYAVRTVVVRFLSTRFSILITSSSLLKDICVDKSTISISKPLQRNHLADFELDWLQQRQHYELLLIYLVCVA